MKRTLATLGVMGLALLSVTATPASAADNYTLCHNGKTITIDLNGVNGLAGHGGHDDDIIPPNPLLPAGMNWWPVGGDPTQACLAPPPVVPPVVVPPVVPPVVVPPAEEPVVVPPAVVETPVLGSAAVVQTPVTGVTPTMQTPAAAATVQTPAGAGAAAVSQGTNQGFNAQTSVGGAESAPTWLAGLGLMLGAGALVAVRRRSLEPKAD